MHTASQVIPVSSTHALVPHQWVFEGDANKGYAITHSGTGKALVVAGHAKPGAEITTSDDATARAPWILNHVKEDLFEYTIFFAQLGCMADFGADCSGLPKKRS